MAYITPEQMIERFTDRELAARTSEDGKRVDRSILLAAIKDADAEIDGYLRGRYSVPVATPPEMLTRLSADIARYFLYDKSVPDVVQKRYDRAVSMLKAITDGTIILDVVEEAAGSGTVAYAGPDRIFSDDNLSDY